MLGYLLGRIIATIPVVVLISLLVFLLIHAAPGDPADLLLSDEASPADIAEARRRWGLDQPIYVQYLRFLANIASGDLGMSFRYSDPVHRSDRRTPAGDDRARDCLDADRDPVFGIPLGVWAGAKPNSWADNLGSVFGFFGISMPSFWLGIMLILIVSGYFNWLPSSGRSTYGVAQGSETGFYIIHSLLTGNMKAAWDGIKYIIMPAIALGTGMMGLVMRVTRSSVLEIMSEDYVRTARAKGLGESTVLVAARASQCARPGHHGGRTGTRHVAQRIDHRRDGVCVAGQWLATDRRESSRGTTRSSPAPCSPTRSRSSSSISRSISCTRWIDPRIRFGK